MSKDQTEAGILPPPWVSFLIISAGVLWLTYQLKEVLVLLVVGYSVAYVLDPILDFLARKKISRSAGVILIFGALLILIVLLALTAVPTLVEQYDHLTNNFSSYIGTTKERIGSLIASLGERFPTLKDHLNSELLQSDKISSLGGDTIRGLVNGTIGFLLQGYSLTLTLLNLLLMPFIVFYLAVDFDRFHKWAYSLFPPQHRRELRSLFSEINVYLAAFVRGQSTVCLILFLLYAFGFWWVGIPLGFLIAVIAGFGNIVPYLGTVSGLILASVMSLVGFGDFYHLLLVWSVFGIVQLLEGFVITPKVVGEKVGLSPLLVIMAIFVGGKLFGLLGIFLAVPGAAVVRVMLRRLHHRLLKSMEA